MKNSYENIFHGKKVLIWGLGSVGGGAGAAAFFLRHGAQVTVTDLKDKKKLAASVGMLKNLAEKAPKGKGTLEFVLGTHRAKDFMDADIVVRSPAIPNHSPFNNFIDRNKTAVESDTSLFMKMFKGEIVGITGTKGKSTIATLIYGMLSQKDKKTFLAGNIGTSVLDYIDNKKKWQTAVVEFSSFGLEMLPRAQKSPHIAVLCNVFDDHLDRYDNVDVYFDAKKNIFRFQKKSDYAVINYDDERLRAAVKQIPSKVVFYSARQRHGGKRGKITTYVHDGGIYYKNETIVEISDIALKGAHNISNVLAAVTVAKLKKVATEDIKSVLRTFSGISGRCESIGSIRGVTFINDTCATNPASAAAGVRTARELYGGVMLIAGGADKHLDVSVFAREAKKNATKIFLIPGDATDKMAASFQKINTKNVQREKNLQEAMRAALREAQKGGCVLLSPGAASFNMFRNEFDRGAKFHAEFVRMKKAQKEDNHEIRYDEETTS